MMVVITLNNCPAKLRGDLSKWLIEINTGVFVGNLNSKVRDSIWKRVCENIKDGNASMVYHTNNEQKLNFRIYNSDWEPVDYDGITLVRHNFPCTEDNIYKKQSKANIRHINRLSEMNKTTNNSNQYVVIDIETTGLHDDDEIIELSAILIKDKNIINSYSTLVHCDKKIPHEIVTLTGITQADLTNNGVKIKDALINFFEFCGDNILVGYNISFDINFIYKTCKNLELPFNLAKNRTIDVMKTTKKKIFSNNGYSLSSIAKHLDIEYSTIHRAYDDCILTYRIFEKLKEL